MVDNHKNGQTKLAPIVALVGCDGSGKSTLSINLVDALRGERRVESCYLGLGSGTIGLRIKALPLIGRALERSLSKKASHTRSKDERIPGLATALIVYGFSMLRLRRFRRALGLRRAGVMIVTDRYPQTEIPGFYDGPGLSAARAGSRTVAWLAKRERRMYRWMSEHRPTLVIRLNVDLPTALIRKPDHDPALIARKIAVTPQLTFLGAPIVELDASAPYAIVRQQALDAVRAAIQ